MTSGRLEPRDARPRWRAPSRDGEALIEPPLISAARRLVDASPAQRLGSSAIDLDVVALARLAREELLSAASRHTARYADVELQAGAAAPLVLAGHQPTLFHPGVWLKNAALGWFAQAAGAHAINVNVDNDTLSSPSIRVPRGTPEAAVVEAEFYDAPGAEVPYEERRIDDPATFASFAERVLPLISPLVPQPSLASYWPLVVESARDSARLGEALAVGRHRWELAHGNRTLEVPLSALCQGRAFRQLAAAWALEATAARGVYNRAIETYRSEYRVRSRNHPAPLLDERDDWIEAPLWCWSTDDPQRRRLFVRRRGATLAIGVPGRAEREAPAAPEPLAECLGKWGKEGWKVRPRALFTTLFLRMLASDLFLHGIGGGLYDRVTDRLMRELFGVEPPTYVVATATLLLPGAEQGPTVTEVRRIDAALRGLTYHPERAMTEPLSAVAGQLVDEKRAWIATQQTRDNARSRAQSLARINRDLQPEVAAQRAALESERDRVVEGLRVAQPLRSREYAFCLFPENSWERLLAMLPLIP